jgi:hypothetical protein
MVCLAQCHLHLKMLVSLIFFIKLLSFLILIFRLFALFDFCGIMLFPCAKNKLIYTFYYSN